MKKWHVFFGGASDPHASLDLIRKRAIFNFVRTMIGLILTAGVVVALVLTFQTQADAIRRAECYQRWANATAERSDQVVSSTAERNKALDDLVLSIPARDPARFSAALNAYVVASERYKAVQAANPLPPSPKLAC